jgi:hypothetical protein
MVALIGLFGVGFAGVGYRLVKSDVRASIYKDRLAELSGEYARVRDLYEGAVRRTAVTELIVKDGAVAIRVRRADGTMQTIPTPFDPAGEVYVDFAVVDGRLMIRRVFDGRTAPSAGVVVDDALRDVEWKTLDPTGTSMTMGKAVYRSLTDGRWVVAVSGDGSLGLRRAGDADSEDATLLVPFVDLKEFPPVEDAVERAERSITPRDLWRVLVAGDGG